MKNIILLVLFALVFVACKKVKEPRDIQLINDSGAYNNDIYSDTGNDMELVAVPASKSTVRRSVLLKSTTHHNDKTSNTTSVNRNKTQAMHKKGWSSAAKGAVIGAGTGAIGGAIISKKKPLKGAVIGGVVGAAGGYIIGKDIDKKRGR